MFFFTRFIYGIIVLERLTVRVTNWQSKLFAFNNFFFSKLIVWFVFPIQIMFHILNTWEENNNNNCINLLHWDCCRDCHKFKSVLVQERYVSHRNFERATFQSNPRKRKTQREKQQIQNMFKSCKRARHSFNKRYILLLPIHQLMSLNF